MSDVFVSYSRRDKDFVARLCEVLSARGKDVWVDFEDIPPTAKWLEEIRAGVDAADAFVFVVSPDSVASDVCRQEIEHAGERNKRIIPILRREIGEDAEIHELAAAHNWIFFREGDDFDAAVETLVAAMETDLEHVDGHTAWLQAAADWERHDRDRSRLARGRELAAGEAWLAGAANKRPAPTALQAEFLHESRRAAARRQRVVFGAVSLALIVAAVLAVVALIQRSEAITQQKAALAGELAANAKLVEPEDPELAVLLAVEGAKISPGERTTETLREELATSYLRRAWPTNAGISSVAVFSPDGDRVAASGADGKVRVFDVGSGRRRLVLAAPGVTFQLAFSPDGRFLATGGGRAIVWDAASGKAVATMAAGRGAFALAYSPDGKRLATASRSGAIDLWDPSTGRRLRSLAGPSGAALAVAWTADGRRLAAGGTDGALHVWDPGSGRPLLARTPGGFVTEVGFDPSGRYVRAVSADKPGGVFALPSGRRVMTLPPGGISDFSPAGSAIAVASGAGNLVNVFELADGKLRTTLTGHEGSITDVSYTGDGNVLTASADRTARLWDGTGGRLLRVFAGSDGPVRSVRSSPDLARVATSGEDGTARLWALADEPAVTLAPPGGGLRTAAVAPGGAVFTGDEEGHVEHWTLRPRPAVRWTSDRGAPVTGMGVSLDGRTLVDLAGRKGGPAALTVSDTATGRVLARPALPGEGVTAAYLSDDDRRLAVGGDSGTVLVVDARSGRRLARLAAGPGAVVATSFDHGGEHLATGTAEGGAAVWDASGKRLAALRPDGTLVDAVALSPDGALLATGTASRDPGDTSGALEIWDARSGRRLHVLRGHTLGITGLSFSADGTQLASGSLDGTARIWSTRTWRSVHEFQHGRLEVRHVGAVDVRFDLSGRLLFTSGALRARVWSTDAGRMLLSDELSGVAGTDPTGREVVSAQGGKAAIYQCLLCGDRDELLRLAAARVSRQLTPEERARYLK